MKQSFITLIFQLMLILCFQLVVCHAFNVWDDTLTFLSQKGFQDEYIKMSMQSKYPYYE